MRHVMIARVTLGITALFVAAVAIFAATRPEVHAVEETAAPEQAVAQGQALFEAQCAGCHEPADISGWAARHPERDERETWLNEVLQRHYPPGDQERPLVIEYIESAIASGDRS